MEKITLKEIKDMFTSMKANGHKHHTTAGNRVSRLMGLTSVVMEEFRYSITIEEDGAETYSVVDTGTGKEIFRQNSVIGGVKYDIDFVGETPVI